MSESPGKWYRQQTFMLAQATFTPIPFWLDLTLPEIIAWIKDINEMEKK